MSSKISSPNKFSKWEKKLQKLKVFQEYFRSQSGVRQESVKNLLVALVISSNKITKGPGQKSDKRPSRVSQESVRSLSVLLQNP